MNRASCAGLALALALLAGCSGKDSPASPGAAGPAVASDSGADYDTRLSMAELMAHVIDYAADGVWLNQGWVTTEAGIEELFPTDDAGWLRAENAALTLAETSNLLLMPGRRLEGEAAWAEYAVAMREAALAAHDAAEARDKEAFFNAGGAIYVVCRDCHQRYIVGETQ